MNPHADDPEPPIEPIIVDDPEREQIRAFADLIARLLDSIVFIPGTNVRVGLDPLIGLIPGLGDIIANLIGSTILFLAVQLHVPKIVILRMALNMGLNTIIGAIPGLGDLFSIWFRSNLKNAKLLRRYTTTTVSRATAGDWMFVILLILLLFFIVIGTFYLIIWGIQAIWN